MPHADIRGARLYYEDDGSGTPPLVFAHGLLFSSGMFAGQIVALRRRRRCVAFDFRGHGRSSVTAGGYDMDALTADTADLIDRLACGPCHFVGHSMGGFVGLRLAVERPQLVASLTLINSSAAAQTAVTALRYRAMGILSRWIGLEPLADRVMRDLCAASFLEDPARAEVRTRWRRQLAANDPAGVRRAVAAVVGRGAMVDRLSQIDQPTLIVAGAADRAVPLAEIERLRRGIRRATVVTIAEAGHVAPIEQPEAVARALDEFVTSQRGTA
jgi:pimeloyl-ACP methyl ester carboxylesterase